MPTPPQHRIKREWAPDPNEGLEAVFAQQAQELGITADDVQALQLDLINHNTSFQQVLGLTDGEMAAMAYRAEELMRLGQPRDALKIYLALTKLNRFEASYWRGGALCFQHMRAYGFAKGYYEMALATDPQDRISELLRAECLLKLTGKAEAKDALTRALAKGPSRNAQENIYVARSRDLLQRLDAMGA